MTAPIKYRPIKNLTKVVNGIKHVEGWKDVPFFVGVYMVSSFGRIKNRHGRIRRSFPDKDGAPKVYLILKNVGKNFVVARLVATVFVGNFDGNPIVCHKDDNPKNNFYQNLFWGTQLDNMKDKCNKGRQANGEKNGGGCKLKEKQIPQIRNKYATGLYSYEDIGKEFGVSSSTVYNIVIRKRWKHVA